MRWVRRFLVRPASEEPRGDQVRRFCEDLERHGSYQEWQVRQAEQALRLYFLNFLNRPDWHRQVATCVVDERGEVNPLAALEHLRLRLRARQYETAALLDAMRGTPRLRATLIDGGGLRVSECCQRRVKDVDFDQGLLVVRSGKGDKERTTLLADTCGIVQLAAQTSQTRQRYLDITDEEMRKALNGVWERRRRLRLAVGPEQQPPADAGAVGCEPCVRPWCCLRQDFVRQSVYSGLAGYWDLNDAERLSADPTFWLIGVTKDLEPRGGAYLDAALVRDRVA